MFSAIAIFCAIIIICCFGILAKIACFLFSLICTILGWAMDGCLGLIIIGIILMFIIGAFVI